MKMLVCGKGGCGKSTVAALLARAMHRHGRQVLLVDADESNIGLYRMLGVDMPQSLLESLGGKKGFRERTAPGSGLGGPPVLFPQGLRVADLPGDCLADAGGVKIMSVGKIHHFGEGCACPMGRLFRMLFGALKLEPQALVIVDAAAGVEHFGRGLDGQCDHIINVVDPSYESIMMAQRVTGLACEAGLSVAVILNRTTPDLEKEISGALDGAAIIGSLPDSEAVFRRNLRGEPLAIDFPEIDTISAALLNI